MFTVPANTPVTFPVLLTVAIAIFPLDQVPPPDELLSNVCAPTHTVCIPVIAFGIGFTVATTVSKQPLGAV